MQNSYFVNIYIKGKKAEMSQLFKQLNALKSKDQVFKSLLDFTENTSAESNETYGSLNEDLPKSAIEYTLHSPTEMYADMETENGIPEIFLQKLSALYKVLVDVQYECDTDDVAGKIVFENGEKRLHKKYRFLEGKYHLDTEKDKSIFWEELQVMTEDVYSQNYKSAEEIIRDELPFLNEKEKKRFTEMYEQL
ncbi:hypothetical protein ACAW74_24430 [Fibrella sp. WM1]|uniref:hypothetical protein n=1 Tax=Fibrella musci TaxID=3242485 RepID=UPI0035226447